MEPWMLAGIGKALGLLALVGLFAGLRRLDRFVDPPPRTTGTPQDHSTSKPTNSPGKD
jgi:hypothetical protein